MLNPAGRNHSEIFSKILKYLLFQNIATRSTQVVGLRTLGNDLMYVYAHSCCLRVLEKMCISSFWAIICHLSHMSTGQILDRIINYDLEGCSMWFNSAVNSEPNLSVIGNLKISKCSNAKWRK